MTKIGRLFEIEKLEAVDAEMKRIAKRLICLKMDVYEIAEITGLRPIEVYRLEDEIDKETEKEKSFSSGDIESDSILNDEN